MNLKQVAHSALSRASRPTDPRHNAVAHSADRVLMTDVSLHGDIGFVLVVHRRRDGHAAEEIYYGLRDSAGTWQEPDHLSGGLVGIEPGAPDEVLEALRGESMAVVSDSESLVPTGRSDSDDGYESVRFLEVLTAPRVDHIEVIDLNRPDAAAVRRPAPHALSVLVAFPGERLLLRAGPGGSDHRSPIRFDGAALAVEGAGAAADGTS
ncbi:hypothetical protein [Streptomyces sp. NPDC014734]|uniref:hypothetical protein n=1 Tax=Streptomyces sp. NPDC014734 TaxID=3364886 RepID=UPI0036FA0477